MRRVTYGVLLFAFLIAALFVADGLQSPQEPDLSAAPPLPGAAALKLAANAQSFTVGYASEADEWAK